MASYPLTALVLRKTKLGETDVILTLLSSDGREVRAVAKGLKKPGSRFGGRLEPYSVVDLLLHSGRNLEVISEVRTVAAHQVLREDLDKSAASAVVADLLGKIAVEGQPEQRLFALSSATLDAIEAAETRAVPVLVIAFLLKALAMHGYRPELRECVECGDALEESQFFSLPSGGALCATCSPESGAWPLKPPARAWLDLIMRSTLADVAQMDMPPQAIGDCWDFVRSFIAYHVPARLKALDFYGTLIA